MAGICMTRHPCFSKKRIKINYMFIFLTFYSIFCTHSSNNIDFLLQLNLFWGVKKTKLYVFKI